MRRLQTRRPEIGDNEPTGVAFGEQVLNYVDGGNPGNVGNNWFGRPPATVAWFGASLP